MGQSCSTCESDVQGEINLEVRGPSDKRQKKGAKGKEAKDKKDKKSKKQKQSAQLEVDPYFSYKKSEVKEPLFTMHPTDTKAAETTPVNEPATQPGSVEETDLLQLGQEHSSPQASDAAPVSGELRQSRQWSMLPSVGTWLFRLPDVQVALPKAEERSLSHTFFFTEAVGDAMIGAVAAAWAVDSFAPKVDLPDPFFECTFDVQHAACTKQTDELATLADIFACPAAKEAAPAAPAVVVEATAFPTAEAFLTEALAWPSADKEVTQSGTLSWLPADKVVDDTPKVTTPWFLQPSVGTWLILDSRRWKTSAACASRFAEMPEATLADVDGSALESAVRIAKCSSGVPASTSSDGTCGDSVVDAKLRYGLDWALEWPQGGSVLATPVVDQEAPWTTTTLAGVGQQSTTATPPGRKIASM